MCRFKNHEDLPRVHKELGSSRGIWQENLQDVQDCNLMPFRDICSWRQP